MAHVHRAPFIVPALTKHTATVIMAHGLGDKLVLVGFSLTSNINSEAVVADTFMSGFG